MRGFIPFILAVIIAQSHLAYAEIFECPTANGGVSYESKPCDGGRVKVDGSWMSIEQYRLQKEAEQAAQAEAERKRAEEQRDRMWEAQKRREDMETARIREQAAEDQARRQQISNAKALGMRAIEYVVSGSAQRAALTYSNASGGTEQHTVKLPWRKMMTVPRGYIATISAQNQAKYGKVTVTIKVDGDALKFSESSSAYGIASASGRF